MRHSADIIPGSRRLVAGFLVRLSADNIPGSRRLVDEGVADGSQMAVEWQDDDGDEEGCGADRDCAIPVAATS